MPTSLTSRDSVRDSLLPFRNSQVVWRLSFLFALFILEGGVLQYAVPRGMSVWSIFRPALLTLAVFLFWGVLKYPAAFRDLLEPASFSVHWPLLVCHLAGMSLLGGSIPALRHLPPTFFPAVFLVGAWFLLLVVVLACGALAFLRWPAIRQILARTGRLWLYATVVGVAASWAIRKYSTDVIDKTIWRACIRATFLLVRVLLQPFVTKTVANPATSRIGTERFSVIIGPGCTGLEGVTLMLVFGAAWLWFFRAELRLPRSLLALPVSLVAVYLLNSVRIAALVLIGHAGAPQIAEGGFHSSFGWISFSGVAIGLVSAAQSRWLRRDAMGANATAGSDPPPSTIGASFAERNATAVYLAPLLAILATALVTRAVSAGFDWLYPLRVVTVGAVLWAYRRRYRDLDWRFDAVSVLLGVAGFVIWIAPDVFFSMRAGATANSEDLANALAVLPGWGRVFWMTFRVVGATLTVPIAEELAFRGFALRRLQSADFDSVNWRSFTWTALLISSLLFGLTHGDRWIAGTVAGLVYAAAMLRRGRIGDAAAAHATTNALLAAWVIARGAWYLW